MIRVATLFATTTFLLLTGLGPAQSQNQPSSLSETYQDWVVVCRTVSQNDAQRRMCSMSQELRQAESRQLVFSARLAAPNGEGVSVTNLVAPFGLLLSNGIRFQVDDGEVFQVDFRTCLPAGCTAIAGFGPNVLQSMRAGANMNVIMTNSQTGEDITIQMSLSGFTTAMDRLIALQSG